MQALLRRTNTNNDRKKIYAMQSSSLVAEIADCNNKQRNDIDYPSSPLDTRGEWDWNDDEKHGGCQENCNFTQHFGCHWKLGGVDKMWNKEARKDNCNKDTD